MPSATPNPTPPHEQPDGSNAAARAEQSIPATSTPAGVVQSADASRVVQRPVPRSQLENPRQFQLSQIMRRFSPEITTSSDGSSIFTFGMKPSDPDFPFELDVLECSLTVPLDYPKAKSSLRVTNKEMGRGYQINVEKCYDDIVQRMPNGTLLQYFKALDKQLESLLSAPPADTIKLVANLNPKRAVPESRSEPSNVEIVSAKAPPMLSLANVSPVVTEPIVLFSEAQLEQARRKREADCRQLLARLGRTPLFRPLSDGNSYIVPVEPRKRSELPVPLQSIKTVTLIVPPNYNLEPCRIEMTGNDGKEAEALIGAFASRAAQNPQFSLVAHINFLTQNMHTMITQGLAPTKAASPSSPERACPSEDHAPEQVKPIVKMDEILRSTPSGEPDRSHIVTIPRPPEWSIPGEDGEETSSEDSEETSEESDDQVEDERVNEDASLPPTSGVERGILISFPNLEMHGIELIQLVSANITVKCDRCKEMLDVNKVRSSVGDATAIIRHESCRKCTTQLSIGMSCHIRNRVCNCHSTNNLHNYVSA